MQCYLRKTPRRISTGRVLMHNHVRHTIDMTLGRNGFRAWTDNAVSNKQFKPCHCGWSGLTHFCIRPDTPCLTADEFARQEAGQTVVYVNL
jgi:hypothetical protein